MTVTSFCLEWLTPACWRYSLLAVQRRNLTYACKLLYGIMQWSYE